MNIKHNLVTPRNGEPIIAATQDFITGCFLLTRRDTFYDRQQFTQICSYLHDANLQIDIPHPTIVKPVRLWTGKQVFNVLMRPNKSSKVLVNLESECKTFERPADKSQPNDMSPNDGYLVVQNSEIMCGVMDKKTVGDGNKSSVFAVIQRDFGPDEAASAMNKMAKLCARWLSAFFISLLFCLSPRPSLTLASDDVSSESRFLDRYQRRHAGSCIASSEGRVGRSSVSRVRDHDSSSSIRSTRESSRMQFVGDARIQDLGSAVASTRQSWRDLYDRIE